MKREIKFRAYAGRNMWHDVAVYENYPYVWNPTEDRMVPIFTNEQEDLYGKPVLMQSTSLKDKNGKEAYFDDIVLTPLGVGVLVWYEDQIGIASGDIGNYHAIDSFRSRELEQSEVIGNIHQHPELLGTAIGIERPVGACKATSESPAIAQNQS